jgi:hypothetical protein
MRRDRLNHGDRKEDTRWKGLGASMRSPCQTKPIWREGRSARAGCAKQTQFGWAANRGLAGRCCEANSPALTGRGEGRQGRRCRRRCAGSCETKPICPVPAGKGAGSQGRRCCHRWGKACETKPISTRPRMQLNLFDKESYVDSTGFPSPVKQSQLAAKGPAWQLTMTEEESVTGRLARHGDSLRAKQSQFPRTGPPTQGGNPCVRNKANFHGGGTGHKLLIEKELRGFHLALRA